MNKSMHTEDENYCWYFCYGSNINSDRFNCYIRGGKPHGSDRIYQGCSNKILPNENYPAAINYQLYFSESSSAWQGGSVAFIGVMKDPSTMTYGRLYLITKSQFKDVAKQETNSSEEININLDEAITAGQTIFKRPSWYGNVLFLGYRDQLPIFTLTTENTRKSIGKPHESYLCTITEGLRETHNLSDEQLFEYFADKPGIFNKYQEAELNDIIKNGSR